MLPAVQLLGKLLVGVELLGQWDVSDALLETPTTTGPGNVYCYVHLHIYDKQFHNSIEVKIMYFFSTGSVPQQHILTPRRLEFSITNNIAHNDLNGHTIVP